MKTCFLKGQRIIVKVNLKLLANKQRPLKNLGSNKKKKNKRKKLLLQQLWLKRKRKKR